MAEDFVLLSTGDKTATETHTDGLGNEVHKQQMVLKKSDGSDADLATQTTLAAILAKLTADPATQTTLAAILAKLIAAPATEAKQDAIATALSDVNTALALVATQDLQSDQADILSSLATKLDTVIASVDGLEAKLDTANGHLSEIETAAEDTDPTVVIAGAATSVTVNIANAASLSGAGQVNGKLVGIILPSTWTAQDITFQVSVDGTNYFNLYDDGTERKIAQANAQPSRFLSLDLNDWLCVNYVKVRSGTSGSPVNQAGGDDIILVLAG